NGDIQEHLALGQERHGHLDRTLVATSNVLRVVRQELEDRNDVVSGSLDVVLLADPADKVTSRTLVLEEVVGGSHSDIVRTGGVCRVRAEERQVALVVVP